MHSIGFLAEGCDARSCTICNNSRALPKVDPVLMLFITINSVVLHYVIGDSFPFHVGKHSCIIVILE